MSKKWVRHDDLAEELIALSKAAGGTGRSTLSVKTGEVSHPYVAQYRLCVNYRNGHSRTFESFESIKDVLVKAWGAVEDEAKDIEIDQLKGTIVSAQAILAGGLSVCHHAHYAG